MGRKNRKFIDKKQDVIHSFKVVQRSQQDPLAADEDAPQGVLIDTECSDNHKEELHDYGVYFDDNYNYLQHLRGVKEAVDWEDCDQEVYTIRKEDPKLSKNSHKNVGLLLPSSAFESFVEERIGLLNRAAPITGPRPELDPDIVAGLDDDLDEGELFDPEDENGLPDNFIFMLNSEEPIEKCDEEEEGGEYGGIEEWLGGTDHYDAIPQPEGAYEEGRYLEQGSVGKTNEGSDSDVGADADSNEDARSDFFVSEDEDEEGCDELHALPRMPARKGAKSDLRSRTSASSSTVARTELLSILDQRFERLYNAEYTDDQIGALDGEVIEGPFSLESEVFLQAVRATEEQLRKIRLGDAEDEDKDRTVTWVKENINNRKNKRGDEEVMVTLDMKVKPEYDCESFASTFASTRNRPRLIDDSYLFKRNKLTKKALKAHDRNERREGGGGDDDESEDDKDTDAVTLLTCISAVSFRPKDETAEERRERKSALKELRRERRKEKKLNQLAFKEEMKRQQKIQIMTPKCRVVPVI